VRRTNWRGGIKKVPSSDSEPVTAAGGPLFRRKSLEVDNESHPAYGEKERGEKEDCGPEKYEAEIGIHQASWA